MNNKDNYKKAVNQIHVRDELKQETKENLKKYKNKHILKFVNYTVSLAAVAIISITGLVFYNKKLDENLSKNNSNLNFSKKEDVNENKLDFLGVKKFASVDELKLVLKENTMKDIYLNEAEISNVDDNTDSTATNGSLKRDDYSRTNNQVENVDEADIVKTDGKYIYYTKNGIVYIVEPEELNIVAKIQDEKDEFYPKELFINEDKLVVLGNTFGQYDNKKSEDYRYISIAPASNATVRVYDISNISSPNMIREISLKGYYLNSRMIENNIYFIFSCDVGWFENFDELKESDITPYYKDSNISSENQQINATDISYFDNTENYNYMLIAGFNLNTSEDVNVETFFGAGSNVYSSENNLYLVTPKYSYSSISSSNIYKFKLDNGNITAVSLAEVPGYVNNQFSIDEYKGNLRIATTIYKNNASPIYENDIERETTITTTIGINENYTNQITIFDENLKQISSIENIEDGEKIYAVRFMGDIRICCNI